MAETEYGKYIFEPSVKKWPFGELLEMAGEEHLGGLPLSVVLTNHAEACTPEPEPMVHTFDQMLWFVGGNPANPRDLGAEIEYSFGKQGEKHVINTSSIIWVPRGTIHCPLNYKKVDKPFWVIDIRLTPSYSKSSV